VHRSAALKRVVGYFSRICHYSCASALSNRARYKFGEDRAAAPEGQSLRETRPRLLTSASARPPIKRLARSIAHRRTMSTRLLPAALGSLLVLLVAGVASAQDQEKGRALAVSLCAHCHMNERQGEKQNPMEVPGFRAIANRPDQSMGGIVTWLRSVPPMMPNHHLTQDEMYDLAAFILSLR
jgi:cytochrome c553